MTKPEVIFFGNGPLADYVKAVIAPQTEIIFHARTREDLEAVKRLKAEHPKAFGVLASYGVIIREDILGLFEPEGILNIHPSLLPDLRGPSPIETAIVRGDTTFGVSVMKLVKAMDAGPIYYQTTLEFSADAPKSEIYEKLAVAGASWLAENLTQLPEPTEQGETGVTFSKMLDKGLSELRPAEFTALELCNQVRAYLGFPKSRYEFFGVDCIILKAHVASEAAALSMQCKDNNYLVVDELQPAGKKPMDAKAFLNGYSKR